MPSLAGHLLVASPAMMDPNFFRTVVLMVQHSEQGALGLVLNRPLETTIAEAWQQVSSDPCPVEGNLHHGGPCEGPLMAVHANPALADIAIIDGLHFSTEKGSIEPLVENNESPLKLFVGYAGWSPGQLESELEAGGWLTTPATPEHIFGPPEVLWQATLRQISDAALFSSLNPKVIPEDPSTN